jgi:hypothetical protein
MRPGIFVLLAAAAGPVAAQQVAAPDYFVASAFETSTAQALARSCTTLSIDPVAMAAHTDDVLARLDADGLAPDTLLDRMEDPSKAIATLQAEFVERHGLSDGAPEAAVCAAGRDEIERGSALGDLLTEVDG